MPAPADGLFGRLALPVRPGQPSVVVCKHPALRLAVVERPHVGSLDNEWDVPGVYILLGPVAADGAYDAYVGQAALQGLRSRLKGPDHKNKAHWTRALLVARDAFEAFHSAEVGWLEGRLWDLLKNAPAANLINKPQPKDETLHPSERAFLEACVGPVAGLLRVLGASPDTLDQLPVKPTKKRRRYDETVGDLIDAKLLAAGSGLHPTETAFTTVATVLEDGTLKVRGEKYETVSKAATAVAGSNRNGWRFWGVPSGSGSLIPLESLRARLAKDKTVTGGSGPAVPPSLVAVVPTPVAPRKKTSSPKKSRRRTEEEKQTSLAEMVTSGYFHAPVSLRATFRGATLEATVAADGSVAFDGKTHTISGAARAAKASIAGATAAKGVLSTDGWVFWRAQDNKGDWVLLEELRRRYVEQRRSGP